MNPYAIATNGVLPNGTVGAAYNQALTASGCGGTCTWSLINSSLPAGLVLTGASGIISGTPTAAFNGSFTIQASGPLGNVQKVFALRINPTAPQALTINNGSSLGLTTIGNNVAFALNATAARRHIRGRLTRARCRSVSRSRNQGMRLAATWLRDSPT